MPLRFGSMTKPVLVTHLCFGWRWAGTAQAFCFIPSASLLPKQIQPGQLTLIDLRDTLYQLTSWSVVEACGKEEKEGDVCGCEICLPEWHLCWGLAFWEVTKHVPGQWEVVKKFLLCFACAHSFCFTYQTISISTRESFKGWQSGCLAASWGQRTTAGHYRTGQKIRIWRFRILLS